MGLTGQATTALNISLSEEKFKKLDPELFEGGFKIALLAILGLGPKAQLKELADDLARGDSNPALVVKKSPLIVAAYSEDLDAVVLLKYPDWVANDYKLEVGSRLITVNTYMERSTGVPADVKPGPNDSKQFGPVVPRIAEFLTDDMDKLEERKQEIPEALWQKVEEMAEEALNRKPCLVRIHKPMGCGRPGTPL